MIKKSISASTVALAATAALWAVPVALSLAQAQPQDPPRRPAEPPAAAAQQGTTLVGCLYREDQIPGRKPNVAERAGVLEDYILADASVAAPPSQPGAAPSATGTTGTTPATGNTYKVEGPSDERLKGLVGKRVEVIGRIDPEGRGASAGGAKPDKGLGPDRISLPEIEASSIREATGTCPATPAPRK